MLGFSQLEFPNFIRAPTSKHAFFCSVVQCVSVCSAHCITWKHLRNGSLPSANTQPVSVMEISLVFFLIQIRIEQISGQRKMHLLQQCIVCLFSKSYCPPSHPITCKMHRREQHPFFVNKLFRMSLNKCAKNRGEFKHPFNEALSFTLG